MVAHAANRNNARNKRMKAIDEDVVSAPDNPMEEGLETALPQKDGATSYGETLYGIRRADIQERNNRDQP